MAWLARVSKLSARLRGKLIRVDDELVLLRPGYVGRRGFFRGKFKDKFLVTVITTGPSTQLLCNACELRVVEPQKNGRAVPRGASR